MESFFVLFVLCILFYTGACVGSFVGVCIDRIPLGQSILYPRSRCNQCATVIPLYALLPIVGPILAKGRCARCGVRISPIYSFLEAFCGLLAIWGLWLLIPADHLNQLIFKHTVISWSEWLLYIRFLWIAYTGIILAFIDMRHRILPDAITLWCAPLSFVIGASCPDLGPVQALFGWVLGAGFLFLVAYFYRKWRSVDGLGMGDIKYLGFLGAALGPIALVYVLLVASVTGACIGIYHGWRTKKGLKVSVPFGPFLALGAVIYLLWQIQPVR